MVVAPTDAETLERAPSRVAESFRLSERSGRYEVVTEELGSGRPEQWCEGRGRHSGAAGWSTWATRSFRARHGLRYPCMSGAMANGIGSVEIVEAMARGGFLGVFGAAGLSLGAIEQALDRIERSLGESTSLRNEPDPQPGRARARVGRRRSLSHGAECGWSRLRRF